MIIRFIIFISLLIFLAKCQSSSQGIPFVTEKNCTDGSYFNSYVMRCTPCLNGTIPSSDRLSCRCPPSFRISAITPTGILCQLCPQGQVVSSDGLDCLSCEDGRCSCPSNNVFRSRMIDGTSFDQILEDTNNSSLNSNPYCFPCREGTIPNKDGTQCVPCKDLACICQISPSLCPSSFSPPTLLDATIRLQSSATSAFTSTRSLLIEERAVPTARRCASGSQQDCQALANLCVIQNFAKEINTACGLLEQARRASNQWDTALDPLFFTGDADSELDKEEAIEQIYMFDKSFKGKLQIVLAKFHLDGRFLGFVHGAEDVLHLCPHIGTSGESFVFGRRISDDCVLQFKDIFGAKSERDPASFEDEAVFYTAYLISLNEKEEMEMYLIPIVNSLVRADGQEVNNMRRDSNRWILTKRFFIADDYSMIAENGSMTTIRYADYIHIHVEMQTTRDGRIYPPYIFIGYRQVEYQVDLQLASTFRVNYAINPFRHDKDIEITMAVLCSLTVLWAVLRAFSYGRRNGNQLIVDASTIVHFVFYECGLLADVFFLVVSIAACWITISYKTQVYIFYNTLTDGQETTLMIYLFVATALKFIALLYRNVKLVWQETFFIDWERPKIAQNTNNSRPSTSDLSKEKREHPAVVWRTYLVANEWNELQNYRKTSVTLQLIIVLLLLEFFKFINYAAVDPGFSTELATHSVESARLTKLAVVAFVYMFVGSLQWILQVLIIEPIITDPFHNFIDLCSIANISVLSLTHSLHGFYIHGRSVHGRADTGMAEMNEFLQRERDNLCGTRGLEASSDLQTFIVCLPLLFRRKFADIREKLNHNGPQLRLNGMDQTTAKVANTVRVHEEMNIFLQELVDHSLFEVDYVVRDATFAEAVLDMEFNDTSQIGNFIRDKSEMAFSSCFIYGNEWINMSFECLLFCSSFLIFDSLILSACLVYVISCCLKTATESISTKRLGTSSLVDQRFLI